MKLIRLIFLTVFLITVILCTGCIAEADYKELQSNYEALKLENISLEEDLLECKEKLNNLEAVCPLKYFKDLTELNEWLNTQPVKEPILFQVPLDQPGNYSKGVRTCRNAVELQEAAAQDGYLISASLSHITESVYVGINIAILENGDLYAISPGDEPTYWFNIEE